MNKIEERRRVAKQVSFESRVEVLEAAVAALLAETKGRKAGFAGAADFDAVQAKITQAKGG